MKRSLFTVAALATTFATAAVAPAIAQASQPPAAPAPASAAAAVAPTGATKIAVIAFQPAVASTNEGRAAFAKIQQKFEPKQNQLKALNDQIETLKKQLQASGSTLSQDARAAQLRSIDDKEKTLQRDADDAKSDYQQEISEAFQGLAQKFATVLQDYAQKNGYGLVIDVSSQQTPVVWAAQSADISAAVIKAYNDKSGVPAPAETPAAPAPSPATHHRTTTTH